MATYIRIGDAGIVKGALSQRVPPADQGWLEVVPPGNVTDPAAQIAWSGPMDVGPISQCYLSNGQLLPRPRSARPMQSGNTVTIPPCPAGTVIHVYDQIGKEQMAEIVADVDGWTDTITFSDPGTYAIEVHEPLPALPSILIVEV